MDPKARLIAFYLPQYHPIPENDEWWGKGFTEWTNVAKAKPLFPGHNQPHLPADLGFYDLRLAEVRQAQAELAQAYGIHGFCYYHYWFNGRRLLERPFNEVLSSGKPDFPFCLCWANENWTRRWDGKEKQVLMAQNYSDADDLAHIQWLVKAFQDERYIRINGKALFLVYRVSQLPNPQRTSEIWREYAQQAGVGDLWLCAVESNFSDPQRDATKFGFDMTVEFQPNYVGLAQVDRLWHRLTSYLYTTHGHFIYDYRAFIQAMNRLPEVTYGRYPCVTPAWDNTARRKTAAFILKGANPQDYGAWLRQAIHRYPRPLEENLVFINAWNEWAEGNHLEPCQRWGHAYLEATRQANTST
ncbi:glycoside hydrolase family 99-like domain-containing protein [Candidatus Cyanaurora vandensis]|uniref:glycosyltransferase WbsX family protein n=1 Tax=Candidatus Cyanaurora vandensis TaxID=2714958 RepID=UPI00257F5FA2|nr:glycoside hydrolase family 99-like domain-containing protein [Candidatus Cyanaurora vandensis]